MAHYEARKPPGSLQCMVLELSPTLNSHTRLATALDLSPALNELVSLLKYYLITNTHTPKSLYEAIRLLDKFQAFLGQFPLTIELAIQFLSQFKDHKLNTKARYTHVLGAFFTYYNGEKLPIKIRVRKILPQYVPSEDIDRLIESMKTKKAIRRPYEKRQEGLDLLAFRFFSASFIYF